MDRSLRTMLRAGALATVLAACASCGDVGGGGSPCGRDLDCKGARLCVMGACVDPPGDGGAPVDLHPGDGAAPADLAPTDGAATADAPIAVGDGGTDAPVAIGDGASDAQIAVADGAGGDGSTCGNGIMNLGEMCCGAPAFASFDATLPTWFVAQYPKVYCAGMQVNHVGFYVVTTCAAPCGNGVGCPITLRHHDPSFDAMTGAFASALDVSISIDVSITLFNGPPATCTDDGIEQNASFQATLSVTDDGVAVHDQLTTETIQNLNLTWAGCGNYAQLVAPEEMALQTLGASLARADAAATLESYSVPCPF